MKVTPWEVEGDVDYNKLIKEFGVSLLSEKIKNRLKDRLRLRKKPIIIIKTTMMAIVLLFIT